MTIQTIGVISDTHGLLRNEVFSLFEEVDLIIHAGDIGSPEVLTDLQAIAPIVAVLGNVDVPYYFPKLRNTACIEILQKKIYVIHNLSQLAINPLQEKISLVIYGHSHQPKLEHKNGIYYFNPGSAGPKRFSNPISLGLIHITPDTIKAQHLTLSEKM